MSAPSGRRIALKFSIVGYRLPVQSLARMLDAQHRDAPSLEQARQLVATQLRKAEGTKPSWEFDGDYITFGKGYHLMPNHTDEDKAQLIGFCDFTELRRMPFGDLLANVPIDVYEMTSRRTV